MSFLNFLIITLLIFIFLYTRLSRKKNTITNIKENFQNDNRSLNNIFKKNNSNILKNYNNPNKFLNFDNNFKKIDQILYKSNDDKYISKDKNIDSKRFKLNNYSKLFDSENSNNFIQNDIDINKYFLKKDLDINNNYKKHELIFKKDINQLLTNTIFNKKFDQLKISNSRKDYLIEEINNFYYYNIKEIVSFKYFFDINANKIIRIPLIDALTTIVTVFLILNQDLIDKKQIYKDLFDQIGPIATFIVQEDFLIKTDGLILIRIPYNINSIVSQKNMTIIYEHLRDNKGIVTLVRLCNLIHFMNIFVNIINNLAIERKILFNDISIDIDDSLNYYSEIYRNLFNPTPNTFDFKATKNNNLHFNMNKSELKIFKKKIMNYFKKNNNKSSNKENVLNIKLNKLFIEENRIIDDNYNKNKFTNYKNKNFIDYALPNRINRALNFNNQRSWQQAEGPLFINNSNN